MQTEADAPADPPSENSGATRWVILAGVWFCYASFGLVATSLAPLVPLIVEDLAISHGAMGSILGAWQLVYIFAAVPCGLLLDRMGARHAIALGGLCIAASALGRSLAADYGQLLFAVGLFGIGGPVVSAGAPKVVTRLFRGSQRGLAMGIYMTGPSIGGIVSLTLTHAYLVPTLGGWRGVLEVWAGAALFASLVWWCVAGLAPGATSPDAIPTGGRPGQIETLRNLIVIPAVPLLLLMAVGLFSFNHGLNNWLPELLRAGGLDLVEAGYWAAIPTVVGIAGSLLIPRLATPDRRYRILFGLSFAAFGASLLLQTTATATLVPGLLLQGIARSSLMTVLILTLVELPSIGEERAGAASGLFFSAAEVGGVLGPLGLGLLYDATDSFGPGLYTLTGIAAALCLATLRLSAIAGRSDA
ncbi:MAG: CynX/NimT family MFS transporter [Myxococcota bacterium]